MASSPLETTATRLEGLHAKRDKKEAQGGMKRERALARKAA
jgi:hypothetical protein